MMHEDEVVDEPTLDVSATLEIYLRDRHEPITFYGGWRIRRSLLAEGEELESFTDLVLNTILSSVDTVGGHRIVISDEHYNKFIVMVDQLQAISILAPSREKLEALLAEVETYE